MVEINLTMAPIVYKFPSIKTTEHLRLVSPGSALYVEDN